MSKPSKPRAYRELRDIIEWHGGTMVYQRAGYRHGAWEISVGGQRTVVEATDSQSFPKLDRLYEPNPDCPNPRTWEDFSGPLLI